MVLAILRWVREYGGYDKKWGFQHCPHDWRFNVVKRIALFNHKGGVSKTTTTFNLGWMLAEAGHRPDFETG